MSDKDPLIAKKDPQDHEEKFSTILAFFTFGFLVTSTFTMMLSAAQDLLAGTSIQTATGKFDKSMGYSYVLLPSELKV